MIPVGQAAVHSPHPVQQVLKLPVAPGGHTALSGVLISGVPAVAASGMAAMAVRNCRRSNVFMPVPVVSGLLYAVASGLTACSIGICKRCRPRRNVMAESGHTAVQSKHITQRDASTVCAVGSMHSALQCDVHSPHPVHLSVFMSMW